MSPFYRLPAVRGIRAAFIFLTRIPVGGFPYQAPEWRWASAHAPLVGWVLGAIVGLVDYLLQPLGSVVAAVLAIAFSTLLTGAFHEDGLADTADALGGGYSTERVLEILKDSRIGTFGGVALAVSVGGRVALLAQLGAGACLVLPTVFALARVPPIWLMARLPYVTSDAQSRSRDVSRGGFAQAVVATAWGGIALAIAHFAVGTDPVRLVVLVAMMVGVAWLTGWRYRRRVGGITGDFLGATEQIGELALLCVLAWRNARGG